MSKVLEIVVYLDSEYKNNRTIHILFDPFKTNITKEVDKQFDYWFSYDIVD